MCEVLPREIRDMIYGWIHTERSVFAGYEDRCWIDALGRVPYEESKSEYHFRKSHHYPGEAHLWTAEFLGETVTRELAEHYFRTVTFQFGTTWSWMPRFRITDQWNLGWVPGEFIANVALTINCREYIMGANKVDLDESWDPNAPWVTDEARQRIEVDRSNVSFPSSKLLQSLEDLFAFRQGTRFCIDLVISGYDPGQEPLEMKGRMFRTMMPIIFSTLERLVHEGFSVKIVLDRRPYPNMTPNLEIALTPNNLDLEYLNEHFTQVSTFAER